MQTVTRKGLSISLFGSCYSQYQYCVSQAFDIMKLSLSGLKCLVRLLFYKLPPLVARSLAVSYLKNTSKWRESTFFKGKLRPFPPLLQIKT